MLPVLERPAKIKMFALKSYTMVIFAVCPERFIIF